MNLEDEVKDKIAFQNQEEQLKNKFQKLKRVGIGRYKIIKVLSRTSTSIY